MEEKDWKVQSKKEKRKEKHPGKDNVPIYVKKMVEKLVFCCREAKLGWNAVRQVKAFKTYNAHLFDTLKEECLGSNSKQGNLFQNGRRAIGHAEMFHCHFSLFLCLLKVRHWMAVVMKKTALIQFLPWIATHSVHERGNLSTSGSPSTRTFSPSVPRAKSGSNSWEAQSQYINTVYQPFWENFPEILGHYSLVLSGTFPS